MSSLGIFNKETQSYQKIAGSTGAAMLDTEMSDTSVNPVQNKVIKKYVDSKQVEVDIASKDKAGIVKPADGLVVAEDGTLKVNLDGTTITMDQVNNVIKLADTLKEKISGALPAANVVNNLTTTEAGFALDARQGNPNVEGTLAKKLSDFENGLNVKKYYGQLVAHTDIVKFREQLPMYNAIYIFGSLVMISFSVILQVVINNPTASTMYRIVTLPGSLYSKIEWNNLSGSFAMSRNCPFIFSDGGDEVIMMLPGGTANVGDELRVFGFGFLKS